MVLSDPNRSPRSVRRRTTLGLAVVAMAFLGAVSTQAMALEFTMFPARDFVEVAGLSDGDVVDVELRRNGQLVGEARDITAWEEAPGAGFLVLVNHPGGPNTCWDQSTPDVVAGDEFRATVTNGPNIGVTDVATVADVVVTQPATLEGDDIVVRGFAQSSPGVPFPLGVVEQRLIHAPGGDLFDNGKRRLQAPDGPNATLAFDGVNWTARYKELIPADRTEAVEAESRILHLGDPDPNDPLVARDITIYEFGVPEGPFDATCPPLNRGPSLDLTASSDTGVSSTDNLTRNTTPILSGQRGTLTGGPVINIYDTTSGVPNLIATTNLAGDGTFAVAPTTPLAEGIHVLRAGQVTVPPDETLGPPLAITIDTTAPAAPTIATTTPASPANDNLPFVNGTAEAGSTVRLFSGTACAGTPLGNGTAAAFLSPGLQIAVADDSTTTLSANADDVAGNTSVCGPSATSYVEVTPKPVIPLVAVTNSSVSISRKNWRVGLRISCDGPVGSVCSGRASLVVKVRDKKTGKRKDVVLGSKAYSLKGGAKATLQIALNKRGQALLENRTSLKMGVKLVATAGAGVAKTSTATITVRAPKK
jgi:Bacterial Ig-like domain